MRCVESNKEVKFIEKYGKVETLKSWEQGFLRVVEWFSNFSEFRELNERLKVSSIIEFYFYCLKLIKRKLYSVGNCKVMLVLLDTVG